jgi:hypothetical protein
MLKPIIVAPSVLISTTGVQNPFISIILESISKSGKYR